MYQEWFKEYEKIKNEGKEKNEICRYCHEDYDGYYKPLDKNAHVTVFDMAHEKILDINWYGHKMKIPINYCPMCGRRLNNWKKKKKITE